MCSLPASSSSLGELNTEEQFVRLCSYFSLFNIDYSLPPQAVVEKQHTYPAQTEKTEKDRSLYPPHPS